MNLANTNGGLIRRQISPLTRLFWAVRLFLTVLSLLSPNPLLSVAALATLSLIWFGAMNNPVKVIVAAYLSFQWLQVSMLILVADVAGLDLGVAQIVNLTQDLRFIEISEQTQLAILLGLACLLVLTFAFRMWAPRLGNFRPNLNNFLPTNLLIVYLCFWSVSLIAGPYTGGGFAQPLIVLGWLRFVPAVLLYVRWLTRRDIWALCLTVCAIETVSGFLGFFSTFRNFFFVLAVVTLALHQVLERRAIRLLSIACVFLLLLGSFWTVIKPTYRSALNLGTSSQALSIGNRLTLLADMATRMDASAIVDGLAGMVVRISYVDYLADVIRNVPAFVAHENGGLWGEAITNLSPRLLFSDKAVLPSDSERTIRYTGRVLASGAEGATISLGYIGDSYVDFGFVGALVVSMLLGAFYALMARTIVGLNRDRELSVVIAVLAILFFPIHEFETSNVKLLGGMIWNWIVCALFLRLMWPTIRRYCTR